MPKVTNGHPNSARRLLLVGFRAALAAVRGDRLVRLALEAAPPPGPVTLVSAGKAAGAMAQGARDVLGDAILRVLVIGARAGHARDADFPCTVLAGDHPVPGERSLAAGRALVEFMERPAGGERLIVCLSGGASSLVEVLPEGVGLADLRRANEWLLGSGWPIGQVNTVRQRLSLIKGGGLGRWLRGRRVLVLALSDVPGNDPALIGSGWLAPPLPEPDPSTMPSWLSGLLARAGVDVQPDASELAGVETRIVGDNATALDAAQELLEQVAGPVHRYSGRLEGEVEPAAEAIAGTLQRGGPGYHLWGGECTVRLGDSPGTGGRCQHLALCVARRLSGRPGWSLLAAGTDGRDGNTDAAGALVDGGTVERGEDAGMDAGAALAAFDSGSFLDAAGDLVDTGPTDTNVNDLVIGARW